MSVRHREHRPIQLNNRGLSLVELLIAMTIIVIVSSAFFSGFVLSAKTNNKAKLQHKATSLAQNILEGLKAEDMDSILRQFAYPTYTQTTTDATGSTTSVTVTNFTILPSGTISPYTETTDAATGATVSVRNIGLLTNLSDGTQKTYYEADTVYSDDLEYLEQTDGKYYLYLNNLMMESTAFDALVTLDGSAYMEQADGSTGSSGQNYNTNPLVQIPAMDTAYDAICNGAAAHDEEAVAEFTAHVGDTAFDESKIKRTITLTVENTDYALSASIQRVSADYLYEYDGTDYTYRSSELVFTNSGDRENQLRNVFLFLPLAAKWSQDEVILNTPDDREYYFYIVKQQTSEATADILQQDAAEASHKLTVSVAEDAASGLSRTDDVTGVKIRTNLGYTLYQNEAITGNVLQAEYSLNGTALSDDDAKTLFQIASLGGAESTERIMNVTIDIYKHVDGAVDALTPENYAVARELRTTLTGTIRN